MNQYTHPDLYFALRGGGSNFGIVTRFAFEAYPYGLLWGGTNVFMLDDLDERRAALGLYDEFQWTLQSPAIHLTSLLQRLACRLGFGTKSTDIIDFFVKLAGEEQQDESAHAYIFLSWLPVHRVYLSGATLLYSKPEANPPVFQDATSLQKIYTTNRLANMSDFVQEIDSQIAGDRRSVCRQR